MRFLADENVARSVVLALRNAGYDVFDIKETGWQGKSDDFLIKQALKNKRIILSHDKDFLHQLCVGVILLRFYDQRPQNVVKYLLFVLESPAIRKLKAGVILTVDETKMEFHYNL